MQRLATSSTAFGSDPIHAADTNDASGTPSTRSTASGGTMSPDGLSAFHDRRPEFFIAMYNQLNAEITRHTAGVWEALGTILAAGGLLSLAEKAVLSLNFAMVLLSLVLTWFVAQTLEANYWYNRNLLII